jgi:hypothetical protein
METDERSRRGRGRVLGSRCLKYFKGFFPVRFLLDITFLGSSGPGVWVQRFSCDLNPHARTSQSTDPACSEAAIQMETKCNVNERGRGRQKARGRQKEERGRGRGRGRGRQKASEPIRPNHDCSSPAQPAPSCTSSCASREVVHVPDRLGLGKTN